jgi:hypothetical protein
MNGYFAHKNIHKFTWSQPKKKLRSIIAYVILRQKSQLKTLDVRVQRGAECGSGHFIVKAKLFVNYKKNVTHIMRDKDETENGEKALKIPNII